MPYHLLEGVGHTCTLEEFTSRRLHQVQKRRNSKITFIKLKTQNQFVYLNLYISFDFVIMQLSKVVEEEKNVSEVFGDLLDTLTFWREENMIGTYIFRRLTSLNH